MENSLCLAEQKIKQTYKKIGQQVVLAIQCLVTQNLSRAARNFHLNWQFSSGSKDALNSHNLLLRCN